MEKIHKTAMIDSSAKLAEGVEVGAYAIIGPNVSIGSGSVIGAHTIIHKNTIIGRNNHVGSFVSLGGDSQSRHDHSEDEAYLEVGDSNTFHEYCCINRGSIHDSGKTVMGNHNIFMAHTHVGHDCRIGDSNVMVNQATLAGHVTIQSHVQVGFAVGVRQFCRVGYGSFIDLGTYITKDVMAFTMVRGMPPKALGINKVGLERMGYSEDSIALIDECYRIVFRKGLTVAEAIKRLEGYVAKSSVVKVMQELLEVSERGLVR